jgi:hypothetical protein
VIPSITNPNRSDHREPPGIPVGQAVPAYVILFNRIRSVPIHFFKYSFKTYRYLHVLKLIKRGHLFEITYCYFQVNVVRVWMMIDIVFDVCGLILEQGIIINNE